MTVYQIKLYKVIKERKTLLLKGGDAGSKDAEDYESRGERVQKIAFY